MEPVDKTPVYHQSAAYAREHGQLQQYRESHWANIQCKQHIEQAIAKHYNGMWLEQSAISEIMAQDKPERISLVLAATIQSKPWDGRFSAENKDWAFTFSFADPIDNMGFDRRNEYAVNTHPAVLDGVIRLVRQEISAKEHAAEKSDAEQMNNPPHKPLKKTHNRNAER